MELPVPWQPEPVAQLVAMKFEKLLYFKVLRGAQVVVQLSNLLLAQLDNRLITKVNTIKYFIYTVFFEVIRAVFVGVKLQKHFNLANLFN